MKLYNETDKNSFKSRKFKAVIVKGLSKCPF